MADRLDFYVREYETLDRQNPRLFRLTLSLAAFNELVSAAFNGVELMDAEISVNGIFGSVIMDVYKWRDVDCLFRLLNELREKHNMHYEDCRPNRTVVGYVDKEDEWK